jgi:hypothetical protein
MSLHQSNNEKEQTANRQLSIPSLGERRRSVTDVAVNRVSLSGEAPLTRGYLCSVARPVNRKIAILLRNPVLGAENRRKLPNIFMVRGG